MGAHKGRPYTGQPTHPTAGSPSPQPSPLEGEGAR